MARRRYIKDYRLIQSVNEHGRIVTDYEYTGDDYRYLLPADELRREKRLAAVLCAVGLAVFIAALIPFSAAMRRLYIAIPFAFSVLPLGLLIETALSVFPVKEPLQRIHADKLKNRWPAASLAAAILSGVAIPGELVNLLLGAEMAVGDIVFCLCAAAECACCAVMFARRTRFSTAADK